MATVLSGVFPFALAKGVAVAPNDTWAIVDYSTPTILHVTNNPAQPNPAYTFPFNIKKVMCDGARWYAVISGGATDWLYRSTDGLTGLAWEAAASHGTTTIYMHAGNGVIFRESYIRLLERSTDAGATWSVVIDDTAFYSQGMTGGSIADFPMAFDGNTWVLAYNTISGVTGLAAAKVAVSTDNGASWVSRLAWPFNTGDTSERFELGTFAKGATVSGGVLYVNAEYDNSVVAAVWRTYRSSDLGVSWSNVTADFPALYAQELFEQAGISSFIGIQDSAAATVTVRQVTGAAAPILIDTLSGYNSFPSKSRVGVSSAQVVIGDTNSDSVTYVTDVPSPNEAVELLSTVSTVVALTEFELTHLQFLSSAIVASATATEGAVSAQIVSSTTVAALVLGAQFEIASLASVVSASPAMTGAGTFAISLDSRAIISFSVPGEDGTSDVWVLNLDAGGFTRYEGFDFNSYAKIGDGYYGCKVDGIYRLDGDTDAGSPIRSTVSFGKQNFGTSALKRITNAYVGVSGQGRLFLKVLSEGQEYTYVQRGYDEHLQVQRFDTGKGLRVNWLEFELYNADGEDFELASVEFAVVPLSRRI